LNRFLRLRNEFRVRVEDNGRRKKRREPGDEGRGGEATEEDITGGNDGEKEEGGRE